MVLVTESRRRNSLNFANERKVIHLHNKGLSAPKILLKVKNLEGERPSKDLVNTTIKKFSCRGFGGRKFRYDRCGRKAWKMTPEVKKFLIQKLLVLRKRVVTTCVSLQLALAREKGIDVEVSSIQKHLKASGYHWLRRSGKRKYSKEDRDKRLAFVNTLLRMTDDEIRAFVSMSMDGVVLTQPPEDAVERENWCRHGDDRIWRKHSERLAPELEGV